MNSLDTFSSVYVFSRERLLIYLFARHLHIVLIQCMTVGLVSVIVCCASISVDFAKKAVHFVLSWSVFHFGMF